MLEIGLGLIMYNVIGWAILIFVFLPFVMNLFNGKGFGHNFGMVCHGFRYIFTLGTAKRSQE